MRKGKLASRGYGARREERVIAPAPPPPPPLRARFLSSPYTPLGKLVQFPVPLRPPHRLQPFYPQHTNHFLISIIFCVLGSVKRLKVPISENFLFSYLNLNITLRTSVEKFFDLHKTRIFYEFYKSLKSYFIAVHPPR